MLLKWSVEGRVMQAVISDRLVIKQTLTQKKICNTEVTVLSHQQGTEARLVLWDGSEQRRRGFLPYSDIGMAIACRLQLGM